MLLFRLGLAWMAGIALAHESSLVTWQWILLGALALIGLILSHKKTLFKWLFPILLCLCLGAARFAHSDRPLPENHLAHYNDFPLPVSLSGTIIDDPEERDTYTQLKVSVSSLRIQSQGDTLPVQGRVLVSAPRLTAWKYGDRVRMTGLLEAPPQFETFDYRAYLSRRGIHSLLTRGAVHKVAGGQGRPFLAMIYALRHKAHETMKALFPDPEASLLAGILLGIERGIPPSIRQDFDSTGTSHIIAISGFNLTILAAVFVNCFGRLFGARRGLFAAGLALTFYTLLVGADAAVVRAAIMGSLTLIAYLSGRQTDALASLSAAGMAMSALDPQVLWDVSFQLSFAATLGLLLYATPLEEAFVKLASRWIEMKRAQAIAKPVGEFLLFTLAAQITTLPLTAAYFQRFPLISPLANVVILPAQAPLMISGGIAMLAGLLWMPLGRILALFAWPFPAFTIRCVTWLADIPVSSLPLGQIPVALLAAFYALLFGLTIAARQLRSHRIQIALPTIRWGTLLLILAILSILTLQAMQDQPDGRLHLHILDVGQGDAVLIESPGGRFVLVNGGSSSIALSEALGNHLPLFRRRLDWVVLAGNDEAHIAGLVDCQARFAPQQVLQAVPEGPQSFDALLQSWRENGVDPIPAEPGMQLDLGWGANAEIITQGSSGAALVVSYGRFRGLLAGAADPTLTAALTKDGILRDLTFVLLPAGGSLAPNPPEWLLMLNPTLVVLSLSSGNQEGAPAPEVLQALGDRSILRTDQLGDIEIVTDGQQLWVFSEKSK